MNKAFIFDLDGVLINNEPIWDKEKKKVFIKLLGEKKFRQLGSTIGLNIDTIHQNLINLGASITIEQLHNFFDKKAKEIYLTTPITSGLQKLGEELIEQKYHLGVVSASPREWIELVLKRLVFRKDIDVVISLEERKDLQHKPSPAGYLEAIKELQTIPASTIILEDSNAGIASAKAAGAYTIGLKQNLVPYYEQEDADVYAETMDDVMRIVEEWESL